MTAKTTARRGPRASSVDLASIWSVLAPQRVTLLGAVVSVVLGSVLSLAPALLMRRMIDQHLVLGATSGLLQLALLYLGAMAGGYALEFSTTYLTTVAAQGALYALRVRLFAHLTQLPMSFHDRTPLGDVISRCTADMDTIGNLFSSGLIRVLMQALQLGTTFIAMVALSPILAGIMVLVLPLLYVLTRAFQRRMRDAERAVRRSVGTLNAHLQEDLHGVVVLRAFDWVFRAVRRFRTALVDWLRVSDISIGYGAVYSPFMNILSASIIAVLFWASASPRLEALSITLGTMTAFVLLFQQFFDPIISIGNEWQAVQSALAGLERVLQVLAMPTAESSERAMEPEMTPAERSEGGGGDSALIAVDDISFGYSGGEAVLAGVSLCARAGEHVAIVGRTGAGKSSLFRLLGGLYRPWSGRVRLAGRDPYQVLAAERRSLVGAVPQVVQLFSGTVRENLTLGDREMPFEAIERAAEITGAAAFIGEWPQGYETPLSAAGRGSDAQLSAGQQQLLALTRALAGEPRVLLLDEATSAIDGASEAAFKRALRTHIEERKGAVLTIAHRLSTALEADYIVVIEAGVIVEEGPTQELLAREGRLAALWELENAGWRWQRSA